MFKELRQRIGQGLTATSGRSSVAHGQVGHTVMTGCHLSCVQLSHRNTANRTVTAAGIACNPSPALYLVWQCYAYSQYKAQNHLA